MRYEHFGIILIVISILLSTIPVFAASQSVIVDAGDTERLTFSMLKGDSIEYTINVDGGRNDDVNFKLRNPMGGTMADGRIVESHGDSWYAQYDGNYVFEFDNEISLLSDKRVDFTYEITKKPTVSRTVEQVSGGCLIATATYGSGLAPQVQQLRELRDNTLLQTNSGSAFMTGFNQFYYSFSPTIADWERQNPIFKETVKVAITPLLTSLSILNYVNMDSEIEVLGYGIGIILLNIGMYFVTPIALVLGLKRNG